MVHVMSSQLLWPTTAKTENPRKEQTDSPRLLFNDVTTKWVTLSNNEPWAIWKICNYDSLLIDLKISSHTCWPFRARGGQCSYTLFGVVTVVFGQPDLTGHPCTSSDQRPGCKHTRSRPWGTWLCWQFEWIIFQPHWRFIKTEIGHVANGVTRELVSNFFGMSPSFYGLFGEKKFLRQ